MLNLRGAKRTNVGGNRSIVAPGRTVLCRRAEIVACVAHALRKLLVSVRLVRRFLVEFSQNEIFQAFVYSEHGSMSEPEGEQASYSDSVEERFRRAMLTVRSTAWFDRRARASARSYRRTRFDRWPDRASPR